MGACSRTATDYEIFQKDRQLSISLGGMSVREELIYRPIGIIHTEHTDPAHGPIQPCYADGCLGTVEVFEQYTQGLKDLDGFSHIILLYHCHRAKPCPMLVQPFLQNVERGLFATRMPGRPNPIGMSIVPLLGLEGNVLRVGSIDVLDRTPLLDIKPYSRRFDRVDNTRNGWQDEVDDETAALRGRR